MIPQRLISYFLIDCPFHISSDMHSVKNEASSNSRDINHCFFNNFSYNYIALYNLGGIIMHRAISNYKITKRKDGRYYVRLQYGGNITHIYA